MRGFDIDKDEKRSYIRQFKKLLSKIKTVTVHMKYPENHNKN